jgi:hypothetical protein
LKGPPRTAFRGSLSALAMMRQLGLKSHVLMATKSTLSCFKIGHAHTPSSFTDQDFH